MHNIHIITTGGTILAQKNSDDSVDLGQIRAENFREGLLIPTGHRLVFHEIANIDSSLMTFDILQTITLCMYRIFEDTSCKGIIILHGTDTLEESAYFLSLCYPEKEERPVIITGSQRTHNETGSDALSNFQHALWAVCSEKTEKLGVSVLFNQALYMPKYVHKGHTHFLQAFGTNVYGMLGTIDNEYVHIAQKPAFSEHYVLPQTLGNYPEIDIYKASLDCTGDVLAFYAEHRYQAIIIEAFGRGNVTDKLANNIKKLINAGCHVIIASDCANGAVQKAYNFSGGLGTLMEYGAIPAFDYSAKKARIKMAVLLACGIENKASICKAFQI